MKRMFNMLLCVALLLAVLPNHVHGASAERAEKVKEVVKTVQESYVKSLELSGKESFAGYCGLMTSYQLWYLGINNWLIANDGNKQFDYYRSMEKTSGDYYIKSYSASEFSLETILNLLTRNGTRDAYNILVGFQSTSTEAGSIYGHSCLINAILDGVVYYAENGPTPMGGAEGNVIACTIKEFADYYAGWTVFEGVVSFGTGAYEDCCQIYGTDLYVRTRFESSLRSKPCLIGKADCVRLRQVAAGELLRVDAVLRDPRGAAFYRVRDGEHVGYIAAGAVGVVRYNGEDVAAQGLKIPEYIKPGNDPQLSGTVIAKEGVLAAVEIMVTDTQGQVVFRERQVADDITWDIDGLNDQLHMDLLAEGSYYVEIYADAVCRWLQGSDMDTAYVRTLLHRQLLHVGITARNAEIPDPKPEEIPDGWSWNGGKWYFYKNGQPVTGWKLELGVAYYLDESGAVTTGWAEVEGKQRYFTATGALVKGWFYTEEGQMYLLSDGSAATGLTEIAQDLYAFSDEGFLQTKGTVTQDEQVYDIAPDGKATLRETATQ